MLVTESNLTRLKKAVKYIILAYITTNWYIVMSANIMSQPINEVDWSD